MLGEIVEDPEARKEVERLRELSGALEADLHKISRLVARPQPTTITYRGSELIEDLRAKLEREHPAEAKSVVWQSSLGEEEMEIDPQLLGAAFLELFANAFAHDRAEGPITFAAHPQAEAIEFILSEPKSRFDQSTENWGRQPLGRLRHGHYSLGLNRARGIFEAHHGTLRARYDSGAAVFSTTVCLPRRVS